MRKLNFINFKYHPKKDLICLFKIVPNRISIKEAANTVALESSVGTWTDVAKGKSDYVEKIKAKVFSIRRNRVKIAYPQELFEYDNVPNILSSIAGNIMGMKAVKSIRLEDVSFPKSIIKSFSGPKYGIKGIREMMKIKKRPLVGTIIKPKLGLNTQHHAQSAYESWIGGCDIVKDDENLSSQKFNTFEKRLAKTLEVWLMVLGVDSLALTAHIGHDIRTAAQHYVSPDIFSWDDKKKIRLVIGDLYGR